MVDSTDATAYSARGRRPHLAESVRLYKSPGTRRPESYSGPAKPSAQPQAEENEESQGTVVSEGGSQKATLGTRRVRVLPGQPKTLNACGVCRLELPEQLAATLASGLASEVKKQVLDMAVPASKPSLHQWLRLKVADGGCPTLSG
ncbi:Fam135a [Symbiodinium natans]|uniref:Fam135a protein n=1 Tax=Symbiodinium natans TaxID=878477 RepID=A0A812UFC4_9DINO|nr:Fam135a [Symbiodinium natans]